MNPGIANHGEKIRDWFVSAAPATLLAMFSGLLSVHFPPAFQVLRYLASTFANIARIGIPAERIRAAQVADMNAQIEALASKMERKDKNK